MLIDHAGYILFLSGRLSGLPYMLMRLLGRAAFPVFAFLIVNGHFKTGNQRAYLSRLTLFAAVSQISFTLAFSAGNYRLSPGAFPGNFSAEFTAGPLDYTLIAVVIAVCLFVFRRKKPLNVLMYLLPALLLSRLRLSWGGLQLLGDSLNVFYTLTLGLALISLIDLSRRPRENYSTAEIILLWFALLAASVLILPRSDYGFMGVLLIGLMYIARRRKIFEIIAAALWCLLEYSFSPYLAGALLALVPIYFYNGKKGRPVKLGFYLFYPAHLLLLYFAAVLIA
jgi:hypothetical protein